VLFEAADINLDAALLTCQGKGSKQRRIPIGKSAVQWLQHYLAIRNRLGNEGKAELFLHRGRQMTRQIAWAIIKTYAAQAGVPDISPHTLRPQFWYPPDAAGADSRSVQALLGHADISTTEIYTHITDLHMRKAYDRFSSAGARDWEGQVRGNSPQRHEDTKQRKNGETPIARLYSFVVA